MCKSSGWPKDCNFIHGDNKRGWQSKEYHAWQNAKSRCFDKKNPGYKNYGARGIRMCDEWRFNYIQFLVDMGRCPKGKSLDRINNDGNYESSNCRWATWSQQMKNKRYFKRSK